LRELGLLHYMSLVRYLALISFGYFGGRVLYMGKNSAEFFWAASVIRRVIVIPA